MFQTRVSLNKLTNAQRYKEKDTQIYNTIHTDIHILVCYLYSFHYKKMEHSRRQKGRRHKERRE